MNFDSDSRDSSSRYWGRHRRKRLPAGMVWRILWRRTRRIRRGRQAAVSSHRRENSAQDNDAATSQPTPERVLYLAWSADSPAQPGRPTRQGTLRRAGTGRR